MAAVYVQVEASAHLQRRDARFGAGRESGGPRDSRRGRLVPFPIVLNGTRVELWFTGKRALHVKSVLAVAGGKRARISHDG